MVADDDDSCHCNRFCLAWTLDLSTQSKPAFEVAGASFAYRSDLALNHVSLEVNSGECVALVGSNGSGKSTLLRVLAALSFVETGTVRYRGTVLTPDLLEQEQFFFEFRRKVGLVFQDPDVQLFNASVYDEVAFAPLQLQWTKSEVRERVEAALEMLNIADLRNRTPHRLSGGEKKRVALASVLVLDPDVLLLDEPAAALDPKSQAQILELLASWRGGSKTVVTATHDLDSLEDICDRCCLLDRGRVAAITDPLTMLHDLNLLERTGMIRPHRHGHHDRTPQPHSHVHLNDLAGRRPDS